MQFRDSEKDTEHACCEFQRLWWISMSVNFNRWWLCNVPWNDHRCDGTVLVLNEHSVSEMGDIIDTKSQCTAWLGSVWKVQKICCTILDCYLKTCCRVCGIFHRHLASYSAHQRIPSYKSSCALCLLAYIASSPCMHRFQGTINIVVSLYSPGTNFHSMCFSRT